MRCQARFWIFLIECTKKVCTAPDTPSSKSPMHKGTGPVAEEVGGVVPPPEREETDMTPVIKLGKVRREERREGRNKGVDDCVYRLLLKGRFPRPITNKAPPRVISNLRAPLCPRGDPSGSLRRGEEREARAG